MCDKCKDLMYRLDKINKIIYSIGAPLGSPEYFSIRGLAIVDKPPSTGTTTTKEQHHE